MSWYGAVIKRNTNTILAAIEKNKMILYQKLQLPFLIVLEQNLFRVVHLVVLTLALFLRDTASLRDIIKHSTYSSRIKITFQSKINTDLILYQVTTLYVTDQVGRSSHPSCAPHTMSWCRRVCTCPHRGNHSQSTPC